jgi:hypothetical protein
VTNKYAVLIACAALAGPAIAADPAPANAPASDKSIHELLELTDAHKLIDTMKGQVNAMVTAASQQAMQGKSITPERQAILDRMQTKMLGVLDDVLNWDTLEGIYLRTYRASFSEKEIDGIIAFYRTPAGKAMVKKLPLVMQNVMVEMQGLMKPMQARVQQIQQEAMQELKDLPQNDAGAKPPQ